MSKIEVAKIATLSGHKDCIYTVEKGIQDTIFFSSGGDGMVVAWNLKNTDTGEMIAKVTNSVYALLYVQGAQTLLVGENFEGIHKIDLIDKKEIASVKTGPVAIFDIKTVGNRVYAAMGDGTVGVFSLDDLSVIKKVKSSDKSARCIAVNESKGEMAIGYSDNFLRIFDLKNFDLIATIPAHQNSIFTAIYSPDGKFLLTGSRDAHLKIWSIEDGYELKESIVAHLYAINHIVYSPDGSHFATCSMDKSVKIWDAKEFKLLKVLDRARHSGHGTSVNKLYWSAYKEQLMSCSDDRTISIWDIKFN